MTEPLGCIGVPPPHTRVTLTLTVAPAITLNGMLLPAQDKPFDVVAVRVTWSPAAAGQLVLTEAVAFTSLVSTSPCLTTLPVAEEIRQWTELTVTPGMIWRDSLTLPTAAPPPPPPSNLLEQPAVMAASESIASAAVPTIFAATRRTIA